MEATIVLGLKSDQTPIKVRGLLVGVDYGAWHCLQQGLIPDMAVGDFDTVDGEELRQIERQVPVVRKLPVHKDQTDTEVTLEMLIAQGYQKIHIYFPFGGRIDHTIANLKLLTKFVQKDTHLSLYIYGQNYVGRFLNAGHYQLATSNYPHKYWSFFALSPVVNLSLQGFAYNVDHVDIQVDDTYTISNEACAGQVQVAFQKGHLLFLNTCDS